MLTQKGETMTNSRIISASGQRLEGPQWCQKRVSNGIKCLSSLFVSYTSPCLLTLNLHPSSAVPNLEGVGWGRGGCTESWSPCCIQNFWGSLMETKTSYHPQKPCDRGCGVIAQACQWGWWGVKHLTASLFFGAKIWAQEFGTHPGGSRDVLVESLEWAFRVTQKEFCVSTSMAQQILWLLFQWTSSWVSFFPSGKCLVRASLKFRTEKCRKYLLLLLMEEE